MSELELPRWWPLRGADHSYSAGAYLYVHNRNDTNPAIIGERHSIRLVLG